MLTSKMGPFLVTIAFSCARAKTIQKRNVWTRIFLKRRKKSPFSNKLVDLASMLFCCFQVVFKMDIDKIWIGTDWMGFTTQIRTHDPNSIHRVAKGFSVTRDGTKIISVMRDQAQISRVSRDWTLQRDAWNWFTAVSLLPCWLTRIPLGPVTWLRTKTTLRVDFHCRLIFPREST